MSESSAASPVEPEVTAGLAEDRLVVLVHLLVAHAAGVDGRRVRVLWVENHRLVGRVYLAGDGGRRSAAAVNSGTAAPGWSPTGLIVGHSR